MTADAASCWRARLTGQRANRPDGEITARGVRLVLRTMYGLLMYGLQMKTELPSIGTLFRPVGQLAGWPVGRVRPLAGWPRC